MDKLEINIEGTTEEGFLATISTPGSAHIENIEMKEDSVLDTGNSQPLGRVIATTKHQLATRLGKWLRNNLK